MKLLALETSTPWCSVALLVDGRLHTREALAEHRHSELLLPMVDELLLEAGLRMRELNGIAFGNGPGAFTGVRIACGVAQGMALAIGVPLAPIGTLLALAQDTQFERVVSCFDARMGQIYFAAYERQGARWHEHIAPTLCHPQESPELDGGRWYGVGSGFLSHAQALHVRYGDRLSGHDAERFPRAHAVAQLAREVLAAGGGVSPAQAAPLYVRDRVALTAAERARGERL